MKKVSGFVQNKFPSFGNVSNKVPKEDLWTYRLFWSGYTGYGTRRKKLGSPLSAHPIRGQYPGHVITLSQSEASILSALLAKHEAAK